MMVAPLRGPMVLGDSKPLDLPGAMHVLHATNVTLYAASGLTGMLAKQGLFPLFFGEESRLGKRAGPFITAGLVLVVANLVDLSAIASVGSAVALIIFLVVGAAGYRRRADTGSSAITVVLAVAVTAIVLVFFAVDTLQHTPETFVAVIAIGLLAVVLDGLARHGRRDRPTPQPPKEQPAASLSG